MAVVLYIAASLDGFIADRDGGVDWLEQATSDADGDYGYADFYEEVSALVMGRRTYEQVRGFGAWPYPGKPTVVFAHAPPDGDHPDVAFASGAPADVVTSLRDRGEGDLWLVGGGALIASFQAVGLIDTVILTLIPILLGDGVPLFVGTQPKVDLRHVDTRTFASGVVQLRYDVA